jgi:hypothetical protein
MTTSNPDNLPMKDDETRNLMDGAEGDAGFQKMLKFKKGLYYCDGEEIDLGTRMIAHVVGYTKTWVHFEDQKVIERKVYRVARGEKPPDRHELPDKDENKWPIGINKLPADPWVLQSLLPMEDPKSGEVRIFIASSFGGKRAVGDLVTAYARRRVKNKNSGQPIITLQMRMMPTKNFGDVPAPHFEIVGWADEGVEREIRTVSEEVMKKQEFDDEIPF